MLRLTFKDSLPSPAEVTFGIAGDFYESEIYSHLLIEDDRIVANPDNVNKLISLFSDTQISQKIADNFCSELGLLEQTKDRSFYLLDLNVCDDTISMIPISVSYTLVNPHIIEFVEKSRQDFFDNLNLPNLRGNRKDPFSQIAMSKLFYNKRHNKIVCKLEVSSYLTEEDQNFLEQYKYKNIEYHCERRQSGEMIIKMNKTYTQEFS